jgi:hypothetical protein
MPIVSQILCPAGTWEYARKKAAQRTRLNRELGSPNVHFFGKAVEKETAGIVGELVFARALHIPATIVNGIKPDNGTDYLIGKCRIDVKAATKWGSPLLVLAGKEAEADLYVLVYVAPVVCTFAGFATAAQVAAAKVVPTGWSQSHSLHRWRLNPIEGIEAAIEDFNRNGGTA